MARTYGDLLKVLNDYSIKFIEKNYGDKGLKFDIPLLINSRLVSTMGRYVHKRQSGRERNSMDKIEMSKKLLNYASDDTLYGTLRHELTHFALHRLGFPYKDGEKYFEEELKKNDAPSTRTDSYNKPIYKIVCKNNNCPIVAKVKHINNIERYLCPKCNDVSFVCVGKIVEPSKNRMLVD